MIPADIVDLLRFARGIEFDVFDDIRFDSVGQFGFDNIFPWSVQLAHDGLGNFWILDIDSKGNWGNVFYVCHDPAVVVKHSGTLSEFIQHLDDYCRDENNSNIRVIPEKTVFEIWENNNGFSGLEECRNSHDPVLRTFALSLPGDFLIADLRNKPNKSGFAWGKPGPNIDKAVRCKDELIWGIESRVKKGFLSKLFSRH